jgi:hypothetical protein
MQEPPRARGMKAKGKRTGAWCGRGGERETVTGWKGGERDGDRERGKENHDNISCSYRAGPQ